MNNKLLSATAGLAICAVSSWSHATEPRNTDLAATSAESWTDAGDFQSQPLPQLVSTPTFADDFSSFGGGGGRAPANRAWARAEFLMWAIKPGQSPPLVQSEGPGGEMTTVFGGNLHNNLRLGGRFTMGTWLDSSQKHGIEGNYFFLNGQSDDFSGSSSGLPGGTMLSRPFIDSVTGAQESQDIFIPGVASGTIGVSSGSMFQGAGLNLLSNLCGTGPCSNACDSCDSLGSPRSGHHWDLITGFRYLNLQEDLFINESLAVFPNAPIFLDPGSTIALSDSFQTSNNFYGGQIGLQGQWWRDRWFVSVLSQVALGATHQNVRINGTTVFTSPTDPNSPYNEQGGLLALTNIGSYSRNRFTAVPQVGVNVGRQITDRFSAFVGYNFIYWSNVVRPGDQFNNVVDQSQLPTPGGPDPVHEAFVFHSTDFWAQGISFGLQYAR